MTRVLVAYGAVLVVLTMLARRFEAAGWTDVGSLEIAGALVDSVLVLAVAAGVWLAGRLGLERWARSMEKWRREQARAEDETWPDAEIIGVTSWRPGRRPLPAPPTQTASAPRPPQPNPAGFTYVGPSYGRETPGTPPFPERPGRRI